MKEPNIPTLRAFSRQLKNFLHLFDTMGGTRPVVVIQNNIGNTYSSTLVVAATTTKQDRKKKMPTHYLIRGNAAFDEPSVIMLEQIRTIDKERVVGYLGKITAKDMLGVDRALMVSLALEHFKGAVVKYIVKEGDDT